MARIRSHGEGSVYVRKDGRWVAQVTLQGRQHYRYFRTKSEALTGLHDHEAPMRGRPIVSAAQTGLGQFLHQWLDAQRSSLRPKTLVQYSQVVRQYLSPGIGEVRLRDLSPSVIQSFYNLHLESGKSKRTVLLMHAVLHSALNQAVQWGILDRNPAQAVIHPRISIKEMRTLTDEEVRSLIGQVRGSRYEVLFWLAATSGLRQGEILGLKWADLDRGKGRLMIRRQLQRLQYVGLVFSDPKSRAGKRVVMLGLETLTRLERHREMQSLEKLAAGGNWQENDLIFPSTIGTPAEPRNLYRHFKMALKDAGLPDVRFHDLRHTAATLMLQQGIHPKVVQERLGHASIALTLTTYSHVLPSIQHEAAEKMDHLLLAPERHIERESKMLVNDP